MYNRLVSRLKEQDESEALRRWKVAQDERDAQAAHHAKEKALIHRIEMIRLMRVCDEETARKNAAGRLASSNRYKY